MDAETTYVLDITAQIFVPSAYFAVAELEQILHLFFAHM
jgi:hypothetical protein